LNQQGQPQGWPFCVDTHQRIYYILYMTYPVHHEEPVINTTPMKRKKEADIEIYVDIEGTLIDDLFNANFLNHQCDNIKEYIHKHDGHHYKVNIYTWGWVHRSEIELGLVDNLYKRIGVDKAHRGTIFVKEDAVDTLIGQCSDFAFDRDTLLQPGGFGSYGLNKPTVWKWGVDDTNKFNVLIDDTVEHEIDLDRIKFINPARMKVIVRNDLDKPATLYNPDGFKVGEVKNDTAFEDVRRQIGLQRLAGYYFMFDGQRIDIDRYGNIEEYPINSFDTVITAAGDLLSTDTEVQSLFQSKLAEIYPQPINPEVNDDEYNA
jgi:hypothetical protein